MTASPFQDAVAIDTNIFEHILNRQENLENHINALLTHLQEKKVRLIVDDRNRIFGEYYHRIGPIIQKSDDTRNEIYLLRYWILNSPRLPTSVVGNDDLMTKIRQVIIERKEAVDRIFCYVALRNGRALISNDRMNIVFGPQKESSARRDRMLNETKNQRLPGADILTSQEAYGKMFKCEKK